MSAYVRMTLTEFADANVSEIIGRLERAHAHDGFLTQFSLQTIAWDTSVALLQEDLGKLLKSRPTAAAWSVLLEYPLYRLRRRIDVVILTDEVILVVEAKVGETRFNAEDQRQVEEYCLDLRDFHAESHDQRIVPILWCTEADAPYPQLDIPSKGVGEVVEVGRGGLAAALRKLDPPVTDGGPVAEDWDESAYRPVPTIIEAATAVFSGHGVREIAQADASNLADASRRLVELIDQSKREGRYSLLFLTGVPGSGKTLAGLQAVHDAVATGSESEGDIVYLSGNTPLVTVLREALTDDEHRREKMEEQPRKKNEIRRKVKARIQHINDFLNEAMKGPDCPPHEHAIVFDEAQRAWDAAQGKKKFRREASEPELLLEVMGRHTAWCAVTCLIGGGQEINSGEDGVLGWGNALRALSTDEASRWTVFVPPDVILLGGPSTGDLRLGELPEGIEVVREPLLELVVPLRTFRSPRLSDWVRAVVSSDSDRALRLSSELKSYPLRITRSLDEARAWLRQTTRGTRRSGLVSSSGARRLRAEGMGTQLHANDGANIAHWYLKPPGDIRSSFALEVTANEYTCQGLELDFVGVCWGGDMVRSEDDEWKYRRLSGPKWQTVRNPEGIRFAQNKYRVLLTRAREGMVLWVPQGAHDDPTREPRQLDRTADFLEACGAEPL